MRLGKVEELLLPFHEPSAGDAAGADRDEGLNDMEAFALRVRIRIQERQNAVAAVGDMKNQKVERQQGRRKCVPR